ncbi:MAG: SMP-30/gluconolactonase/LRE family protein [Rhizobiales bacterium]|nr:SMP-30/gluconolactonase/LRE family protein [Hyphomicrobiales bacterium]
MSAAAIQHAFSTGGATVLPADRASVLFDGIFSSPRLQHPEGIAVGPDGWIWVGSENGQILRIAPDGSAIEEVASTGGFLLGLAFDGDRALFACDSRHSAVFRLDLADRSLKRFTAPGIQVPNYAVVDRARGRLYVSDTRAPSDPGPSIWSYDLDSGVGAVWHGGPFDHANGMALSPEGDALFLCETFARRVTRIVIKAEGSAGAATTFSDDLPGLPDGLAFDDRGALFVSCYEPSRVLRVAPGGGAAEVYVEDATAHVLAHPTNIAFDGARMFTANLGRWHVTKIETDTSGTPLWRRSAIATD